MDISSSNPTQPGGIRDQHRIQSMDQGQRRVQDGRVRQQEADEVIISARGRLLEKLGEAVREAPDVREDRVAALREAVEQGRYQVSAVEIARAMLASRGK